MYGETIEFFQRQRTAPQSNARHSVYMRVSCASPTAKGASAPTEAAISPAGLPPQARPRACSRATHRTPNTVESNRTAKALGQDGMPEVENIEVHRRVDIELRCRRNGGKRLAGHRDIARLIPPDVLRLYPIQPDRQGDE